jgi:hypothetical protein
MDTRHALGIGLLCVVAVAAALVLAAVLDAPWLRLVAVVLLLGTFVAREIWAWWGEGRTWLAMVGAMLAVVVLAFAAQKVTG